MTPNATHTLTDAQARVLAVVARHGASAISRRTNLSTNEVSAPAARALVRAGLLVEDLGYVRGVARNEVYGG